MLTAPGSGESLSLSTTGEAVWAMLQAERRTVDRLVMALARRSTGQALAQVPDLVRAELECLRPTRIRESVRGVPTA